MRKSAGPSHTLFGSADSASARVSIVQGPGQTAETGQPHLGPGFVRPRALFVRPVDIVIDRRRSLRRVGRRRAVTNPGSLRVGPQARVGSNCIRAKASGPGAAGLACRVRPPPPPPSPRTKWTRRVPHPVLIGHAAGLACRVRASSRSKCPTFLLLAILRTPSRPGVI